MSESFLPIAGDDATLLGLELNGLFSLSLSESPLLPILDLFGLAERMFLWDTDDGDADRLLRLGSVGNRRLPENKCKELILHKHQSQMKTLLALYLMNRLLINMYINKYPHKHVYDLVYDFDVTNSTNHVICSFQKRLLSY